MWKNNGAVWLWLGALFAVSSVAFTQTPMAATSGFDGENALRPAVAGVDCAGGRIYDDGTLETPLKPESVLADLQIAMRFDPGVSPARIETVCVCWGKSASFQDDEHDFDIVLYDDDGPGGRPGTLLGRKSVRAAGITGAPGFHGFDVSDLAVTLGPGSVYVGVDAVSGGFTAPALCGDTNGSGNQPIYSAASGGSVWTDVRTSLLTLRALGVRARTSTGGGGGGGGGNQGDTSPCVPGEFTLCVVSERFEITAVSERSLHPGLAGRVSPVFDADLGGAFHFFLAEKNFQAVVKVSLRPSGYYAVAAASVGGIPWTITVRDTWSGRVKEYTNPGGGLGVPTEGQAFPVDP